MRKDQDIFFAGPVSSFHQISFVVNSVDINTVTRHLDLCMWSLDGPGRRLVSVGSAFVIHNGLSKSAGHNDLVVGFVVVNVVRVTHQLRSLSSDISHRRHIAIRQPGECRDLREGHSVEGDKLTPFRVVCDRSDVAEQRSRRIRRGSANGPDRRDVA